MPRNQKNRNLKSHLGQFTWTLMLLVTIKLGIFNIAQLSSCELKKDVSVGFRWNDLKIAKVGMKWEVFWKKKYWRKYAVYFLWTRKKIVCIKGGMKYFFSKFLTSNWLFICGSQLKSTKALRRSLLKKTGQDSLI